MLVGVKKGVVPLEVRHVLLDKFTSAVNGLRRISRESHQEGSRNDFTLAVPSVNLIVFLVVGLARIANGIFAECEKHFSEKPCWSLEGFSANASR